MSDSSKTAKLLSKLVSAKDAKGIAISALQKIQDSMKTTGGDSLRSSILKNAASIRANGNEALAKAMEAEAAKLPESKRGVSIAEAIRQSEPHLLAIGKTAEDVFSNGIGALTTKVLYSIGIEDGTFEKPEKPAKLEKPTATVQK